MATIVQFMHPGGEPKDVTPNAIYPWNTGKEHFRKFMKVNGKYLIGRDNNNKFNSVKSGEIVLWGEWEPQSYVERIGKPNKNGLPEYLHIPVLTEKSSKGINTDPYVFGDAFIYSNCRQTQGGALQKLNRGDIILFCSSKLNDNIVLDTVFVVGSREEYSVNAEGGCPKIAKIECPVSAEKDVQLCSNAKVIPLKFDIESLWDRQKRTRERVRLAG